MNEVFILMLAGHLIGDFVVQTDYQALSKSWWPGHKEELELRLGPLWANAWWRSVISNQSHVLTYHLTMAAFVLPVWHTWGTAIAFAISWVSHGFIDRRWPVRGLLELTGSPKFAEQLWGVISADQALHIAILAVLAATLAP